MCWTGDESKQRDAQDRAREENELIRARAGTRVDPASDPRPPGNPQPDRAEMDRAEEQIHSVVPA